MIDLSPGSETRKIINKEFFLEKHTDFRNWYFKKYSDKELKDFKNNFYEFLSNTGEITTFIPWFIKDFVKTMKIQINTLQLRNWRSVKGEDSQSPFPLTRQLRCHQTLRHPHIQIQPLTTFRK